MNPAIVGRTLQFVQISSAFGKRAADEIGVHRAAQQKAAALRPELLQHMLDAEVLDPSSKEAADAMLGEHATTMGLLKAAVDKIKELRKAGAVKVASDLGGPDSDSKPGQGGGSMEKVSSLDSPFVGGRHSDNVEVASDAAFRSILNK